MRLLSLIPVLLLVFAGCDAGDPSPAQSQVEADLTLALGETGRSDGLTITFEQVLGDSRCPVDVVCVWEGEAHVRLRIDGASDSLQVVDPELGRDAYVQVGEVRLRAVALTPYPDTRRNTDLDVPAVFIRTERVTG